MAPKKPYTASASTGGPPVRKNLAALASRRGGLRSPAQRIANRRYADSSSAASRKPAANSRARREPLRSGSTSGSETTDDEEDLIPAKLSIDFGASHAKAALAFERRNGHPEVTRVPRPDASTTTNEKSGIYEFDSEAGFGDEGKIVVGRNAASKIEKFSLKTGLMLVAGVALDPSDDEMPGAAVLLSAIALKRTTKSALRKAIRTHLKEIRRAADQTADNGDLRIDTIVITYPNFLSSSEARAEREARSPFAKYMDALDELITDIWPDITQRYTVSEGQGAAAYAAELFDDPLCGVNFRARRELFEGMRNKEDGLHLLVADFGSSSLNLQVVNVYFKDGRPVMSQTSVGNGWLRGTKGGSHIANGEILKLVQRKMAPLVREGNLSSDDIAAMVQDFERQKETIDFTRANRRNIILHCEGTQTVAIKPDEVDQIFGTAFDKGLEALLAEVHSLLRLGKDFGILFCGGSFGSPGLRNRVDSDLNRVKTGNVTVRHAFLNKFEQELYPTSAVSVGAALSALNIPAPAAVMRDSAVGVQVVYHDVPGTDHWLGEDQAYYLFSRGSASLYEFDADTRHIKARDATFQLVCDPAYGFLRRGPKPPLNIGPPREVLNGPPSTYNLSWSVRLKSLPPGILRFSIAGRRLMRIARDMDFPESAQKPIPFVLKCVQVDEDGHKMSNALDRQWSLTFMTDPPSKLLIVHENHELPARCTDCMRELGDRVHVCEPCRRIMCPPCYVVDSDDHAVDHDIVSLDLSGEDEVQDM